MTNILVTGGAGYIGSHTCKALAASGYHPVSYDNLCRGNREMVRWGELEVGDIADAQRLRQVVERYRPKGVLHFAAYGYVGESVRAPSKYFMNNVAGTVAMLEVLREQSVRNLVFSSSCATYGIPDLVPIPSDHPQRPVNPYGLSKLMVEQMLREHRRAYGLRHYSLRYFNAAGADPDGDIGEHHEPETHVVPLAILTAIGRLPVFRVFGDDYETPDGSAVRDYVHVSDLAAAHVLALDALLSGSPGGELNLGTGRGTSVLEIIKAVERTVGVEVAVQVCERRAGDPPMLIADPSDSVRELGWTAEHVTIDEIVRTAHEWHRAVSGVVVA